MAQGASIASSSEPPPAPIWTTSEPLAETLRLLHVASKRWEGHDAGANCVDEWQFAAKENPLLKQFRRVAVAASRAGHQDVALRLLARATELTLQLEHCVGSELALAVVSYAQIGQRERATSLIQSHPKALRYDVEVQQLARAYHIMGQHDRARELLDTVRARYADALPRRKPRLPLYPMIRSDQRLALAYGAIEEQDIAETLLKAMPIGYQEIEALNELAAQHTRAGRRKLALRTLRRVEHLIPTANLPRRFAGWDYAGMKGPAVKFSMYESDLGPPMHVAVGYARLGMPSEVARVGRRPGLTKRFTQVASWVARSQPSGTPPSSLERLVLVDADTDPDWRVDLKFQRLVGETLIRSGVDQPWYLQEIDPGTVRPSDPLTHSVGKADVVFGILADHIVTGLPVEPEQLARLVHEVERQTPEEWSDMW